MKALTNFSERTRAKMVHGQLRTAIAICIASSALLTLFTGCSDESGTDFAVVEEVILITDPESVTFNAVAIEEESRKTITIFNQSSATALINFSLTEQPTPNDTTREFNWAESQRELLKQTVTLQGGDAMTLLVTYTPRDEYRDTGAIVLNYNGGQQLTIPLDTSDISPDIDGPSRVLFGRVPAGGTVSKNLLLQNVGRAPLNISDMFLGTNSEEFTFCFPVAGAEGENSCVDISEDGSFNPVVEYLETIEVRIVYSPIDDGEDTTEFKVESNDPDERPFIIEVNANGAEPCILVSDESGLDFGTAFIGGISQRTMTITNCSPTKELEVSAITMTSGSDEEFFVDALPGGLPDSPMVIDIGGTSSFVVNYAPSAEAANEGTIDIRSSDAAKSPLLIPVNGRGSNNACPTAVGTARVQGSGGPALSQLEAIPLDTIQFDGTASNDPDNAGNPNAISRYEWSIIERPTDSTARFVPNDSSNRPSLFLDLAGRYLIELTVYDAQNTPSCEPAQISILATPNEDIHIQLVWDTDNTDIDLHFLHPNGRWNQSPYDCHWLNKTPNWANINSPTDDPSLDIDDVDGFGPENINLDNPENVTYRVGAHYYSDHFNGASNATIRIWLSSVLVFEYRNKFMTDQQFWDTSSIQWGPAPQTSQIDMVYPSFP